MTDARHRRTPLSESDHDFAVGRVREWMAAAGLTQTELARRTQRPHIPPSRLSEILNGRGRLTEATLGAIAVVLQRAPVEFLPPRGITTEVDSADAGFFDIGPAVEAYAALGLGQPEQDDLAWLRSLPPMYWLGLKPSAEVLYHLVQAHRADVRAAKPRKH